MNNDSAATKQDRRLPGAGLCQPPAAAEKKNHFDQMSVSVIGLELYQQ